MGFDNYNTSNKTTVIYYAPKICTICAFFAEFEVKPVITQNYIRRQIDDVISVNSIVTVYHIDFRSQRYIASGESHDFPEIFYIEEGYQTTALDGVPYSLEAGQLLIYGPNTYHGPTHISPHAAFGTAVGGIISFETKAPQLESLYNKVITLTASQRETYSEIITRGLALFEHEYGGGHVSHLPKNDYVNRELQYMKNMLEIFLLDLYSEQGNSAANAVPVGSNKEKLKDEQMKELTRYFLDNLDKTLTLEQISRDLGFSVSKLRRLVFEQKECGPIAYFIDLKIEEAKRLIRKTSMNITEISECLGFSSLHYFSKQFKNKTGKSPSAYAKTIDKR